jgi:hypothetical protein
MKFASFLKLTSIDTLFAKRESALAGIWTRVERATAAYTIPAMRNNLVVTGLYYQGYVVSRRNP